MATTIHRFAIGGAAGFAPLAIAALVSPAISRAAECGGGDRIRRGIQHLRSCGGASATSASANTAAPVER